MDTYYETQFKKKDPYIKFWAKTNDKDFDKQKIGLYVSWLEMIARRRKVRKAFLRYLNVTNTEDAGHFRHFMNEGGAGAVVNLLWGSISSGDLHSLHF